MLISSNKQSDKAAHKTKHKQKSSNFQNLIEEQLYSQQKMAQKFN